jgi:hypothetical protein
MFHNIDNVTHLIQHRDWSYPDPKMWSVSRMATAPHQKIDEVQRVSPNPFKLRRKNR